MPRGECATISFQFEFIGQMHVFLHMPSMHCDIQFPEGGKETESDDEQSTQIGHVSRHYVVDNYYKAISLLGLLVATSKPAHTARERRIA